LLELVAKSEELSRCTADRLIKAFSKNGPMLVLYCGNTEGLAQHICSTMRIAKPSLNIAYLDGDYSYNIVLPYIAEDIMSVVLVASSTELNCVNRVLQALALVGVETVALLPTVTLTKLENRLEILSQNIYTVEIESDVYRLTVLQASLRSSLNLSRGEILRIKRFEKELDMKIIVKELTEKYYNVFSQAKSKKHGLLNIAVSKSLLAAGEELIDRGLPIQVIGRKGLEHTNPDLLVYTSVEEQTVNEYLVALSRKGIKRNDVTTVKINTDPFTAPIYALIIFYSTLL
jgi:hypothetical protein